MTNTHTCLGSPMSSQILRLRPPSHPRFLIDSRPMQGLRGRNFPKHCSKHQERSTMMGILNETQPRPVQMAFRTFENDAQGSKCDSFQSYCEPGNLLAASCNSVFFFFINLDVRMTPSIFRPIPFTNSAGSIFFAPLAKSVLNHMTKNSFIDLRLEKGSSIVTWRMTHSVSLKTATRAPVRLQAWSAFLIVRSTASPGLTLQLLAYQCTIVEAAAMHRLVVWLNWRSDVKVFRKGFV